MGFLPAQDTLSYQLKHRPVFRHRDMSWVSCSSVAHAINAYMSADGFDSDVMPEVDALRFYMWDHAVAEVRRRKHQDEPLGELMHIVTRANEFSTHAAVRAFYYLLLICVRESRHLTNLSYLAKDLSAHFGQAAVDFNAAIQGSGSVQAAMKFREMPPDMTLGDLVSSLRTIFYQGGFSGGYGGAAWGAVTDCLVEFVHGKYTAATMLDTIWTLCHNNGPIFNKGMLYECHGHGLIRILDVQRSGQIPQYIEEALGMAGWAHDLNKEHHFCELLLGGVFSGYVDWFAVEALGAVKQYPNEKKAQVAKHGVPPHITAISESNFEVMQGLTLKKIKLIRKKAA